MTRQFLPRARVRGLVAALLAVGAANGCMTYSIMEHQSQARALSAVPGVPFFAHRGACRHETTYLQNLFSVRLLVESVTWDQATERITKTDSVYNQERVIEGTPSALSELQRMSISFRENRSDKEPVIAAFERLRRYDPGSDWRQATLVLNGNSNTVTSVVDYSRTYYYNVQRPVVGSTTANIELGADGTLNKAEASVEDNTLTTIGGFIPFTDIISSALLPDAGAHPQGVVMYPFQYTLTINTLPLFHTLARVQPLSDETCPSLRPISPTDTAAVEYSRRTGNAAADTPKESSNAITVAGQISLPKKE